MRAPLSWLRDYAPFDQPVDVLAGALSNLGLVVDGITRVGGGLDGVVVGRILAIRPHPQADRIRLVDVTAGGGETLQIACGAWNMEPGDLVALATVGTVLPGGMEIGRRKMRGEWSEGMLCAAEEVGLLSPDGTAPGPGADGLLILPPALAPPGTPLAVAMDLREDAVFDLDVTPNRPDALCMAGVARDLAAALGVPWSRPSGTPGEPAASAAPAPGEPSAMRGAAAVPVPVVIVEAPDLCPRFTATVIAGVASGPSPAWLARRLTLAGMRPINAVVDVSNYVMLDVGQPTHAYDLDRLGGGGILVRRSRPNETLVTLDGVTRSLAGEDCLICDANSAPIGLGGIMGGAESEISAATTTVLLEAAYFTPVAVARTGKRLGLGSEARTRFERGIDPEIAPIAVERFVDLLGAAGPGSGQRATGVAPARGGAAAAGGLRRGPTVDVRSAEHLRPPAVVRVRTRRINALLGTDLDDTDVVRLISPLGFGAEPVEAGIHTVSVPSWRPDTEREVDVVEEVARLYGFDRIARTVPSGPRRGSGLTAYQRERRKVRDVMVGTGLDEAWTTTFLAPGDLDRAGLAGAAVEVQNPLDQSESVLRRSLLPGLLKAIRFNRDRQANAIALFEIGRVFAPPSGKAPLPEEHEVLGAVLAGPGADSRRITRLWAVLAGALRLDECILEPAALPGLHPGRGARIVGGQGASLGAVGEVDAGVVAAFGLAGPVGYFDVDLAALLGQPRRSRESRPVSRYPASDLDLAFVVADGVAAAAVAATLAAATGELLEDAYLFDVYRSPAVGAGRRSLAYRLRFRAFDRTLSDAELAELRSAAVVAVAAAHRAELRG